MSSKILRSLLKKYRNRSRGDSVYRDKKKKKRKGVKGRKKDSESEDVAAREMRCWQRMRGSWTFRYLAPHYWWGSPHLQWALTEGSVRTGIVCQGSWDEWVRWVGETSVEVRCNGVLAVGFFRSFYLYVVCFAEDVAKDESTHTYDSSRR